MENKIHILPTDKPSRLQLNVNTKTLILFNNIQSNNESAHLTTQNIYITNSEEIKDDEWHLHYYKGQPVISKSHNGASEYINLKAKEFGYNKIILTTDPQLIADGVQKIDDEFIEWFVKNPSCEIVEVEKKSYIEIKEISYEGDFQNVEYVNYKIIIPKEEPKCTCKIGEPYNNTCCKVHGSMPQEEPKQDLEKEMFELEQQLDIPSNLRWHNSKPKQETLEEAAERFYGEKEIVNDYDISDYLQSAFLTGYKLAQERSYSEEEVRNIANWAFGFYRRNDLSDSELEEKFSRILNEQFKKK